MKRNRPALSIILVVTIFSSFLFAQTRDLPFLKKNESYAKVRGKLLRAGWKPFHAKDSDKCQPDDSRCQGRPEMHVCAGTGLGNCEFYWKRKGKLLAIYTVGEAGGIYSGHKFLK